MVFNLDFLGFGSRRRSALRLLDRTLASLEVNPAYVDEGMKYLVYKWVEDDRDPAGTDQRLKDAAALISFCVLGPTETSAIWGDDVCRERARRFDAALALGNDDALDVKLIKLVLAKGVAAPEISAVAGLE